jgi:hypothetical protein
LPRDRPGDRAAQVLGIVVVRHIMKRDLSSRRARELTARHLTAVKIEASTVVDICDLLEADTIEVIGAAVTFTKVLPTGDRQSWTGEFGHWMVADADTWTVLPDAQPATWVQNA